MRYAFPCFFLVLFFSSCVHKDVLSDRADNVAVALIYSGAEGTSIITKEEVFQAQNKESNGAVTTISGYAEYRLTAYDPATGNQTGRVNLGEGMEKAFIVLGITPGKLWLYSIDPGLGFHCRNPKTLEIIKDEKALSASGPLKGFAFARPGWAQLNRSYGWSAENEQLILSDMQGFHYYFNPEKQTLEKTGDEIVDYTWAVHHTGNTGHFTKENYVSLRGNGRKKLTYHYEDSTANYSYLKGELLLDINPSHAEKRKRNALDAIQTQEKILGDSLSNFSSGEKIQYKISELQRELDALKRETESIRRKNFIFTDAALLSDASGNFFVMHATDISDTARMQLTKVNLDGKTFTETWTIRLADFYYDPAKADTKGAFEKVFSEGNPNFTYQWFEIAGDRLFMIAQLQLICIDIKTGKTLWLHPL